MGRDEEETKARAAGEGEGTSEEIEALIRQVVAEEMRVTMRKVVQVLDETLGWPGRRVFQGVKEGFRRVGLL